MYMFKSCMNSELACCTVHRVYANIKQNVPSVSAPLHQMEYLRGLTENL